MQWVSGTKQLREVGVFSPLAAKAGGRVVCGIDKIIDSYPRYDANEHKL